MREHETLSLDKKYSVFFNDREQDVDVKFYESDMSRTPYVFAIDFNFNPLPYILELRFPVGKRIFLISEDKDKK